ncbi:MAG: phosphate ABC transporter permease subunit PstC, partial [Pigmentiphaga sp.]
MSAVLDNNVPVSPAEPVAAGAPAPKNRNRNALMDALFKNLTRTFAFLV